MSGMGVLQDPTQQQQQPPMLPTLPQPAVTAPGKLAVGTVKNFHVYTGGDPQARASWQPLQGEQFLNALYQQSPGLANRVKAASEGRLAIPGGSGMGANAPDTIMLKNAIAMYDPERQDSIINGTRAKVRKDFSSGPNEAAQVRQLNQLLGHLDEYSQNMDSAANWSMQPVNQAINSVTENYFGHSKAAQGLTTLGVDRTGISSELAALLKGKGSSNEEEVKKWFEALRPETTLEEKRAAVAGIVRLARPRLDELQDQYQQGMGGHGPPLRILNPDASQAYKKLINLDGRLNGPSSSQDEAAPHPPEIDNIMKKYPPRRAHL